MYLFRTEAMATAGRAVDLEDYMARLGELTKTQPGFQQRAFLNSLSYPAKYSLISRWDSREAFRAFIRSKALGEFQQASQPAALSTPTRPAEGYEFVVGAGDPSVVGKTNYVALVEWTVNAGVAADFEATRKELFELRQKLQQGFVANRLWRLMGIANRYLVVLSYASREGAQAFAATPENQAHGRAHPLGTYTAIPPIIDTFEVVSSVVAGG